MENVSSLHYNTSKKTFFYTQGGYVPQSQIVFTATIPDSDEFVPPSEGDPIPTGPPTTGATSKHIDTPSQSTPLDDNPSPPTADPPAPSLRCSTRIQVPTQDFLDSVGQEQLDFLHRQHQPTQEFLQDLDQNTMTNSDIVPPTIAFNAYYEALH